MSFFDLQEGTKAKNTPYQPSVISWINKHMGEKPYGIIKCTKVAPNIRSISVCGHYGRHFSAKPNRRSPLDFSPRHTFGLRSKNEAHILSINSGSNLPTSPNDSANVALTAASLSLAPSIKACNMSSMFRPVRWTETCGVLGASLDDENSDIVGQLSRSEMGLQQFLAQAMRRHRCVFVRAPLSLCSSLLLRPHP